MGIIHAWQPGLNHHPYCSRLLHVRLKYDHLIKTSRPPRQDRQFLQSDMRCFGKATRISAGPEEGVTFIRGGARSPSGPDPGRKQAVWVGETPLLAGTCASPWTLVCARQERQDNGPGGPDLRLSQHESFFWRTRPLVPVLHGHGRIFWPGPARGPRTSPTDVSHAAERLPVPGPGRRGE